jgi:hypothetical protein
MIKRKETQIRIVIEGLCYAHNFLGDISVFIRSQPNKLTMVGDNEITKILDEVRIFIDSKKHILDHMKIK